MANDPKTTEWRQAAHKVIKQVAEQNHYVVSDMVVAALEDAGLGLDNYSSLGGVFKRAANDGFIQKTAEKQQSTRGKSHSAKTVWISCIYDMKGLSPEARALTGLIMASLDFNTETVRYASMIYRSGGLDKVNHKRAVDEFSRITDRYQARASKALEEYEKVGGRNGQ